MQRFKNLSTREISSLLVETANIVAGEGAESLSKPMLEKCNLMLRIAKTGIQTIAVMTVVAKMKGLDNSDMLTLPHVVVEDVE